MVVIEVSLNYEQFILLLAGFLCVLLVVLCKMNILLPSKPAVVTTNESVFITGCDSGIGFQCARLCDRLGFSVYAGCLFPEGEGAKRLLSKTTRVEVVDFDIIDIGKVQRAVDFLNSRLHSTGLWGLVNNAGVLCYGEFSWQTWDQCKKQVDVNLIGTLSITKLLLPLVKKRRGRIVTITSVNGLLAYPLQSVYCATKFALEGFFSSLQFEMRRYGVSVSCIQLGDFARLTNIMAGHKTEARIMWDAMSADVKDEHREYFWHIQELIQTNCGATSPESFKDSPLYGDIQHALLSQWPQSRYLCTSRKQQFVFRLIFLLPNSFRDALVSFVFKKLTQ